MVLGREERYINVLIRSDKKKNNDKLRSFILTNYPKIVNYIRKCIERNECPVCHRKFRTKYALYKHLQYSQCYKTLYRLIELIHKHVPEEQLFEQLGLLATV